ncbi:MAG: glycosyltransferase family 2 protein [Candidatus Eisenbacteria bacterium]|uniref:Glycosyltransferase family 2 protein n=1 Tax=Eiseniibacteriota bacterium TaxID=2212470 RepID=A0A948S3J5_UNCEI|nr:glycosyltransferase family 2 protein [Candidatus Eisenbacteria bacterium]MBU1947386.1 glycosyltransferase family 2 protein [Candidatus Eisenbacteria bacterium]MBU2693154.1 glycosyltransferase family 2 protein [Candidatus Eisenbacteria bacterium]
MKLSVIMPAYNEESTIEEILSRVKAVPIPKEILVVDDASVDGTVDLVESLNDPEIRLFRHDVNQGKGAAIRTAIPHCTGDIIVIQDADLEYCPEEFPNLIRPIVDGLADVVYGSRFLGGPHRVHLFWHWVGNQLLTLFSNMMTNINLSDMETCYKAFRTEILKSLTLRSNRFGFEPEVTAKVSRLGCRIYETPISYHGRGYSDGKKIGWRDGFVAFWTIIKYRFTD